MIEKMEPNDFRPNIMIQKINELIDGYNELSAWTRMQVEGLSEKHDSHYHKIQIEGIYNTTQPYDING